jgi:hypothetical protein
MSEPLCQFEPASRQCVRCGYVAKSLPTFRACKPPPPPPPWQPIAIGDVVERWLTRIGITRERVERWTRTAGKPGGCGCEARKRWLNDVGFWVQWRIRSGYFAVQRFYLGE